MAWAANDAALSFNGSAVVTDAALTLPTLTRLLIGCDPPSTSYRNGHIKRLTYFPTRRTDADLQVLST
jgi:hypothetical protein